jgi:transcriptional regulator with XRE-family HTH domain
MTIHRRIREGRLKLGLTEQQFGERVGVTRAAVQQWERLDGKATAPSRRHQAAVAHLLGMTVAELISGEVPSGNRSTLSPQAHMLGEWLDKITEERSRFRAYVAAMQAIVDHLPGNDLPPTDEHISLVSEEISPAKPRARQARG